MYFHVHSHNTQGEGQEAQEGRPPRRRNFPTTRVYRRRPQGAEDGPGGSPVSRPYNSSPKPRKLSVPIEISSKWSVQASKQTYPHTLQWGCSSVELAQARPENDWGTYTAFLFPRPSKPCMVHLTLNGNAILVPGHDNSLGSLDSTSVWCHIIHMASLLTRKVVDCCFVGTTVSPCVWSIVRQYHFLLSPAWSTSPPPSPF